MRKVRAETLGDDGEIGDFDTGEGGGEVTKLKLSLQHGRRGGGGTFLPKNLEDKGRDWMSFFSAFLRFVFPSYQLRCAACSVLHK